MNFCSDVLGKEVAYV